MKKIKTRGLKGWQLPAALDLLFSAPLVMGVQPQSTPASFDIKRQITNFTLDPVTCPSPPPPPWLPVQAILQSPLLTH